MKNIYRLLVTIVVVLTLSLSVSGVVWGDSLWNDQSSILYGKTKRDFQVGDLLTVIVVEQASASQKAGSTAEKDGSLSVGKGTGVLEDILPEMSGAWGSEYEGQGTTTRGGSLNAKLTVTINEVTPEGLLRIEGQQTIRVNKEDQILTITGKVRPEDVNAGNIVYSTFVADAIIEYEGKGTLGDTQRPGILTRIFNWIF